MAIPKHELDRMLRNTGATPKKKRGSSVEWQTFIAVVVTIPVILAVPWLAGAGPIGWLIAGGLALAVLGWMLTGHLEWKNWDQMEYDDDHYKHGGG